MSRFHKTGSEHPTDSQPPTEQKETVVFSGVRSVSGFSPPLNRPFNLSQIRHNVVAGNVAPASSLPELLSQVPRIRRRVVLSCNQERPVEGMPETIVFGTSS
jgi:hypothetical protein